LARSLIDDLIIKILKQFRLVEVVKPKRVSGETLRLVPYRSCNLYFLQSEDSKTNSTRFDAEGTKLKLSGDFQDE